MASNYVIFLLILFIGVNASFLEKMNNAIIDQEKLTAEECKESTIIPNSENVKFIGRFYIKDDIIWLVLSGSAIEFYLTGKSAQLNLAGDGNSIYMAEDQRPRYAVYIDDEKIIDKTMGDLEKTIELFKSEEEKEIKVRIILLSEGARGAIGVKSININSCSEKIIRPSEYKDLRIEYIGDSITCAWGIESASEAEPFLTTTQNFELTYAFLSAKELNADYSGVCYSGSGVAGGGNQMPKVYTQTNAFTSYFEEWDFTKFPNDVVVINLGTNDMAYSAESKHDEYIQEYTNFLGLIRQKNPDAYIVCTLGMMGCEQLFPLIEKAISLFGDPKVYGFLLPNQKVEDGIGSQYHPNYVTHAKAGKIVYEKIKEILESN